MQIPVFNSSGIETGTEKCVIVHAIFIDIFLVYGVYRFPLGRLKIECCINFYMKYFVNKQRELTEQGIQQERSESPTVTPPSMQVNYKVHKFHQSYVLLIL